MLDFNYGRFKHSLLPCLIAMCADCDANTFQLGKLGKLITVIAKYLENSVRAGEILASHTSQQQQQQQQLNSTSAGGPPVSAASTAAPVEPPLPAAAAAAVLGRAEEAQHVRRLSNIIPKELWHVNLVTLSRN